MFKNLDHFQKSEHEEIDASSLNKLLEKGNVQVIDVREPDEFDAANIGGVNIPLAELSDRFEEIDNKKRTVVLCQSGKRSSTALELIKQHYPNIEISNFKGGLNSYLL